MSKSILGSLAQEAQNMDMGTKLKLNRFNASEKEKTEPQNTESQIVTAPGTENPGMSVTSQETSQKAEITKAAEQKGKKNAKNQQPQTSDFDWSILESFTENIPEVLYGKASQRLSDDNKAAYDEMAKRIGVPAVHLINHVLTSFRHQFRKEFEKKYPARII